MKLLRLELTDWRQFRGGPHAILFDDRSTILAGPNEAGKSTIFEAIRRALFDRCRSTAQWVQHIVPYGIRGAVPMVLLEFEHNGKVLRIEKAFGGQRGTATLSEQKDGVWMPIARRQDADEQLRELLDATFSNSSEGAGPENWGAFQWLFVPQDERDLPADRSEAIGHLGLPQAGVSDDFKAVLRLVDEAYKEIFTPTGRISTKSRLHHIEEELGRLRKDKEDVEATLRELDEKRRRYEEIQDQLPALKQDADQAKEEWERALKEHVDLSGAEGECKAAQARHEQKKAEADEAKRILKERLDLEKADGEAAKEFYEAGEERASKVAERDRISDELSKARNEVRGLESQLADAHRSLQDASDLSGIKKKQIEKKRLAKVRDRIRKIEQEIEELKVQLIGKTPSMDFIDQIAQLVAQAEAKRAAIGSSALRVTVNEAPDLEVLLDGRLLEGKTGTAIEDVLIAPPSGGSVRVEGDTRRAQQLADEAKEIEQQVKDLLDPFTADSLPALRALREERLKKEGELRALERERLALDSRQLSEIDSTLARLDQEIETLQESREKHGIIERHDTLSDRELEQLVDRLRQEITEIDKQLNETRTQRDGLYQRLEDARDRAERAESAYQAAKARKEGTEESLDRHRDRFGSTDTCQARMKSTEEELQKAEGELDSARASLEKLKEDAEIRRTTAQQKYDHLRKRVEQQKARAEELARRLEEASDKGYYAKAADLVRQIASEEARLTRITTRAEAIKLLKETMETVRSSVVQRVVAPIKEDLDARLASATRGRYRLATLGDELVPQRLQGDVECAFDDGSQGLRELVNTLLRMSIVAHLAEEEPQALILDDPCVHVSRERTARVVELLNQLTASGKVQTVILTHRENEFAGLEGRLVEVQEIG